MAISTEESQVVGVTEPKPESRLTKFLKSFGRQHEPPTQPAPEKTPLITGSLTDQLKRRVSNAESYEFQENQKPRAMEALNSIEQTKGAILGMDTQDLMVIRSAFGTHFGDWVFNVALLKAGVDMRDLAKSMKQPEGASTDLSTKSISTVMDHVRKKPLTYPTVQETEAIKKLAQTLGVNARVLDSLRGRSAPNSLGGDLIVDLGKVADPHASVNPEDFRGTMAYADGAINTKSLGLAEGEIPQFPILDSLETISITDRQGNLKNPQRHLDAKIEIPSQQRDIPHLAVQLASIKAQLAVSAGGNYVTFSK